MSNNIKLDKDTKKRIIEKSKLTTQECFALDGYIVSTLPITERKILAYSTSRKAEPTDNEESLMQLVYRWFRRSSVLYYIEDKEIELFGTIRNKDDKGNLREEGDKEDVIRDKEQTILELNLLANQTNDPKLKSELLLKLADLQQWKKKEDDDKESRITYYQQVKCSTCPIYTKAKHDTMAKSTK